MRASKIPRVVARDLSSEYVVSQIKAQMAAQCAIEVEATKAMMHEQLVQEQQRYKQSLDDRDQRADAFCTDLRVKYEDLMLHQEAAHQRQFLQVKATMEQLLATHLPLQEHSRLLQAQETAMQQAADTKCRDLEAAHAAALHEAVDAERRRLEACHEAANALLQAQLTECQAANTNLTRLVHSKSKGARAICNPCGEIYHISEVLKLGRLLEEERVLRAKKETSLHESCRHLLTLRNQVKASAAALREAKEHNAAVRKELARVNEDVARVTLDLVRERPRNLSLPYGVHKVQTRTEHAGAMKCLEQELQHVRAVLELEKTARMTGEEKAREKVAALKEAVDEKARLLQESLVLGQLDRQRFEQLTRNFEADLARATAARSESQAEAQGLVLEQRVATAATNKDQMEAVARAELAVVAQKVLTLEATLQNVRRDNAALKQELRMEQQLVKR
ncbi:hypothetical protein ACHHYP_01355 [Achlya hypogyna]|uniref:Uncharacterized protein n=1 Tax=Achlya hypogyna TaxID=1202772 RepID=A0A1V9ZTJ6_ACHHY|nr:hypothetical protein ACHHYP_01355 [Achlya hypogyna]